MRAEHTGLEKGIPVLKVLPAQFGRWAEVGWKNLYWNPFSAQFMRREGSCKFPWPPLISQKQPYSMRMIICVLTSNPTIKVAEEAIRAGSMSLTPKNATRTRGWGSPTMTRSPGRPWPPSWRTSTACWCSWPWASGAQASLSLQAELYKITDLFRYIDLLILIISAWSWCFLVILILDMLFILDLFSNIYLWSWSCSLILTFF